MSLESYSSYAMCLGGAWLGFAPSLICNENVLLKHPIPANILSINHAFPLLFFALAVIVAALSGPTIK